MVQIAERHTSQLKRLKDLVEKSYLYFKSNYDRYNKFREFVFETSMDGETIALLKTLKKPQMEFNIGESYLSRLRGEFSKQEPSIEILPGDEMPYDQQVVAVVQGHMKHILQEANKNGMEYNVYTDTLSGGFSAIKVWTEYANEMSFNQVIRMGRVYDPVLCGWDPLAQQPHKGDGNFCFELFPRTKDDFKLEYPDINLDQIKFNREIDGFNWSYKNSKDDILLICDLYEKKKKRVKIVQLSDGKSMRADKYEQYVEEYRKQGFIEQEPQIVKERYTEVTSVMRYRFIEDQMLEVVETDYKNLPIIFIDGNSILLRRKKDFSVEQFCRPYLYHARDIQKLKNFAGQTLANELENMVQHKFMVAKESLPIEEDYLQAYRDVQQADVLIYNAFGELAPDKPLPQPQVIPRVNIPPEVYNTFLSCDQMLQNIIGNFDNDLAKLNQAQMSGIAIIESISQNNSAAMPYIVGYLQGFAQAANVVVDLIPKYVVTPRTIPIVGLDGKKDYVKVNQPQGVNLMYEENALDVRVEAGVNFAIQKSRAMNMIIQLMQASPLFAEFMNTEGLEVLLDNVEIKGIDQIKMMAKQWMDQKKQMQQQQMQMQQQMMMNNPQLMKVQNEAKKDQMDMIMKEEELKVKHADAVLRHDATIAKTHAEIVKAQADMHMKHADLRHKHEHDEHRLNIDLAKTHHEMTKPEKSESKTQG